mgnify:CR=1 FL=1
MKRVLKLFSLRDFVYIGQYITKLKNKIGL